MLHKQDFVGVGFVLHWVVPTVAQRIWEKTRLKCKWSYEKENRNLPEEANGKDSSGVREDPT